MARARNIKPALFKNEILGVADPLLTLLFESLWCLADREGRLEDRPLRIKAETFPYRENLDINGYLTELERMQFICRYVVDGVGIIQVENFLKHQNPHKTERPSDLPEMPMKSNGCRLTVTAPLINGSHPADSLVLTSDSLITNPLSTESLVTPGDVEEKFSEAWDAYPKRPGASKADSFKAWKARIKGGATADEILNGTRRYAAFVLESRTEPQYVKQPATFFGAGEHYKADWATTARPSTQKQSRNSGFEHVDYSEGIENGRIL